jgi:protein dithiol:quinone oxidoreductase
LEKKSMALKPRMIFALMFLACAGLIGFGLYLQYAKGLEPCPLCILQRYAFVAIGLVALVATLHNPGKAGQAIYSCLSALFALGGLIVAGRHVWLEHLPKAQVPACGPGLDFILDAFPLSKALPMIFKGSGECADVAWRFLSLSISEWAFVWFVLLGMAAFLVMRKR